jgi:hypothetical protein
MDCYTEKGRICSAIFMNTVQLYISQKAEEWVKVDFR